MDRSNRASMLSPGCWRCERPGSGARARRRRARPGAVRPYRIDIHHHFAPPAWVTAVKGRPLLQPANTTWTPAKSIEDMDRGGVAAAMVSITNPGLWFGDAPMTRTPGARLQRLRRRRSCATIRRDSACLRRCRCPTWTARCAKSSTRSTRSRPTASASSRATATGGSGHADVPAGDGGAAPPPRRGARASDGRQLLPQSRVRAGRGAGQPRVRHRHHARHHRRGLQRRRGAVSRTSASSGRTRAGRRRSSPSRIDGASRGAKERMPAGFMAHAEDVLSTTWPAPRMPARSRRCCSSCRRRRCSSAPISRPAAPRRTT